MTQKNLSGDEAEALRFENEFLKAKIAAQYGGIHGDVKDDTPPEVMNAFLNNIINFEESRKKSKEVKLYDLIGSPDFLGEEKLSDEQLVVELKRLKDLMFSRNIVYNTVAPVENRLLYKFVTEELFQQTVSDKTVPGMLTYFMYEEFHPNHEYDSAMRCEEFLLMFFSGEFHDEIKYYFPEKIRNLDELSDFHDAFKKFSNLKYEISDEIVVPENCIRKATISFDAITGDGTTPIHFEGEAFFELDYQYDSWIVNYARFPGMKEKKE
jgi:hypothetical protein